MIDSDSELMEDLRDSESDLLAEQKVIAQERQISLKQILER